MREPRSLFPVLLPSFFLLSAMGSPVMDAWTDHRQVFGSENYYLTVSFAGHPDAGITPGTPARFHGSLVTSEGEYRIHGKRRHQKGQWVYEIQSPVGGFTGRLEAEGCPRFMTLSPQNTDLPPERLRAGSCL